MEREGILTDASALIYLSKAEALRTACDLVGALLVPRAVWREVVDVGEIAGRLDSAKIRAAHDNGWLRIVELDSEMKQRAILLEEQCRIGQGESEVLAAARKNEQVLLDDARAMRVAKALKIIPIRTIALPAHGFRQGLIDAPEALRLLQSLATVIEVRAGDIMKLKAEISGEKR